MADQLVGGCLFCAVQSTAQFFHVLSIVTFLFMLRHFLSSSSIAEVSGAMETVLLVSTCIISMCQQA
jgi:hypothetical protein